MRHRKIVDGNNLFFKLSMPICQRFVVTPICVQRFKTNPLHCDWFARFRAFGHCQRQDPLTGKNKFGCWQVGLVYKAIICIYFALPTPPHPKIISQVSTPRDLSVPKKATSGTKATTPSSNSSSPAPSPTMPAKDVDGKPSLAHISAGHRCL